MSEKRVGMPPQEEATVKEALQLRPAKAVKIEQRRLLSVGETYPVEIPRPQAEILAEKLEKGEEVWHVTPRKEETLVLAVFDHEPTADEVTPGVIEEFLENSLQKRVSVKIQKDPLTDFKDLDLRYLKFKVSDGRSQGILDMAGLARYMDAYWWQSRKIEKPPEIEKVELEKWNGFWRTFPVGTTIYTGQLGRGHVDVQGIIKEKKPFPVTSIEVDPSEGFVHYHLLLGGYITRRLRSGRYR